MHRLPLRTISHTSFSTSVPRALYTKRKLEIKSDRGHTLHLLIVPVMETIYCSLHDVFGLDRVNSLVNSGLS